MKTILILGAGRSSPSLISYLLTEAARHDWKVIVGDADFLSARNRIQESSRIEIIEFNVANKELSMAVVEQSDIVISLLPAALHPEVAMYCLVMKKHLLTASYVSDAMKKLHADALSAGL